MEYVSRHLYRRIYSSSISRARTECLRRKDQYSEQKIFIWTRVLFRTVSEIGLFECTTAKLLIRKRYYAYVLFLIPVFIVQVAELVQFIINVRKFHRQHQCTLQLVWSMACCSSECVLAFLYASDNIQYVNEQFVSCIHFFLYTSLFIKPHKQKSNGVKSGDLGGQLLVLPWPIHLLGKVSLRCCITCQV